MDDKELKKKFEEYKKNARIETGKPPRCRKKSSLHQIIKTKEQADKLMEKLRALSSRKSDSPIY